MGLDNGIYVKNLNRNIIPKFVKEFFDTYEYVELCYWRKCWNIRNDILKSIGRTENNDEYEIKLDSNDIKDIMRIVEKYLDHNYYSENDNSIWEYEEITPHNVRCYINLYWLYYYMEDNPDTECYFYDSY